MFWHLEGNLWEVGYMWREIEVAVVLLRRMLTFGNSLNAPTEVVKQIIINIEAGVEVEVTIAA